MKVCSYPFKFLEIREHGVYPCCCGYTNYYSLGKWQDTSFDEIWHGQRAKNLRQLISSGDYLLCDLDICKAERNEWDTQNSNLPGPERVEFCQDTICNLKCIMCRDSPQKRSDEYYELLDSKIDTFFLPCLAHAKYAYFSGDGDVFASPHYKKLIKMAVDAYPQLLFDLHTNGLLCDRENLEKLGILNRIDSITFSIHASSQSTYKKITRSDKFQRIIDNFEYVSALKKDGCINTLRSVFVVMAQNVHELSAFAEYTIKHGGVARIWEVQKGEGSSAIHENFATTSIMDPSHPLHSVLLEELKKISHLDQNFIVLSPRLKCLMQNIGGTPRTSIEKKGASTNNEPVFIHSLPFSGGQAVLESFRSKSTYCLADPYNSELSSGWEIFSKEVSDSSGADFIGNSNYPKLTKFVEYAPFMMPEAKTPWHFPAPSEISVGEAEKKYLEALIAFCHHKGRTPVLQLEGIPHRLGLIKKAFGGKHILLIRSPFSTYQVFEITGILKSYRYITKKMASTLGLRFVHMLRWQSFCIIYLLMNGIAAASCDLIINFDKMLNSADYLKKVEGHIYAMANFYPNIRGVHPQSTRYKISFWMQKLYNYEYNMIFGTHSRRKIFIDKIEETFNVKVNESASLNLQVLDLNSTCS